MNAPRYEGAHRTRYKTDSAVVQNDGIIRTIREHGNTENGAAEGNKCTQAPPYHHSHDSRSQCIRQPEEDLPLQRKSGNHVLERIHTHHHQQLHSHHSDEQQRTPQGQHLRQA